jgi:hypothetical protein
MTKISKRKAFTAAALYYSNMDFAMWEQLSAAIKRLLR